MARRAHDEGSIFEYPKGSGIWYAQLPEGDDSKRPKRRAASQNEALGKLRELWREREMGVDSTLRQPTVKEFMAFWLEHVVKPKWTPGTVEAYASQIRLYINPTLGNIRLGKLGAAKIQHWLNGLTIKSASSPYQRLRSALDLAVRWGYIPKNYAREVQPPSYKPRKVRPLTETQALQLLNTAKGDRLAALYELAIWLGLREAELIGLRWEDLDLTKRTLTISGQILRRKQPDGKSKLIRQPPKSTKSARTIPLSDGLVATLRAHQARIYAERLKAGPAWRDNDLVFPTTKGTPLDRKTLVTHFKALLSAAGLPETTRFHDLRHSAASLMLDDGAQPTDVRDILGHASLQTLDKVYGHSYDEGKRRTIEAQERRLRRGAK